MDSWKQRSQLNTVIYFLYTHINNHLKQSRLNIIDTLIETPQEENPVAFGFERNP